MIVCNKFVLYTTTNDRTQRVVSYGLNYVIEYQINIIYCLGCTY